MTAREGKDNARKDAIHRLQAANPGMTYLAAGEFLDRLPKLKADRARWRAQVGVDGSGEPVWLNLDDLDGSDIAVLSGNPAHARTALLRMLGQTWKAAGARVIVCDTKPSGWHMGFEFVSAAQLPELIDELEAAIDPFDGTGGDALDGPQTVLLLGFRAIKGATESLAGQPFGRHTDFRRLRSRKVRVVFDVPSATGRMRQVWQQIRLHWFFTEYVQIMLHSATVDSDGIQVVRGQVALTLLGENPVEFTWKLPIEVLSATPSSAR